MRGVVRGPAALNCVYGRMQGRPTPPLATAGQMPMPEPVSVPDEDLRSTERSLLGTLAGVLSAVPDYLFAWLVERDEEAVPLFESRRLAQTLGRQVPLGPLDLLRAAVEPAEAERLEALIHAMSDGRDEISGHLLGRRDDGARHADHADRVVHARAGRRHARRGRDPRPRAAGRAQRRARAEPRRCRRAGGPAAERAGRARRPNRQLAEISITDYLTGAHNRRHFMDVLQRRARRRRPGRPAGRAAARHRPVQGRQRHVRAHRRRRRADRRREAAAGSDPRGRHRRALRRRGVRGAAAGDSRRRHAGGARGRDPARSLGVADRAAGRRGADRHGVLRRRDVDGRRDGRGADRRRRPRRCTPPSGAAATGRGWRRR